MQIAIKQSGFTLLEAIIYIALFSILFTGIFISIYPIFTGAERLTANVAADSESAFILSKINYAINNSITSSAGSVTVPAAGGTATELVLSNNGEKFKFSTATTGCAPGPIICRLVTLSKNGGVATPLNSSRVRITGFKVTHNTFPHYIDVVFAANGATTSARYYLRF